MSNSELSEERLAGENEDSSGKLYNLEVSAFDLWVMNSHDEASTKLHACSNMKRHKRKSDEFEFDVLVYDFIIGPFENFIGEMVRK